MKKLISIFMILAMLVMIPCEVTAADDINSVSDSELVLLPKKTTQPLNYRYFKRLSENHN